MYCKHKYEKQMNRIMRKLILLALVAMSVNMTFAQRKTDKLDRGLVAVPSGSGNLVSWRVFGEEYYDVKYNLYKDGSKIAENLSASNYLDNSGTATTNYQVAAVVKGVEQAKCNAVTQWANGYKSIPVVHATDRNGNDVNEYYTLNDVTLGDLTGNGVSEFIVKRPCNDANDIAQNTRFNQLDCYDLEGNRLWWIDLGPNMIAGPDEQWDCVAYDWDQDGKAEVLLRCADDVIIHFADGTTQRIGSAGVDTRYKGIQYTYTGKEYLVYLEGATGKPYQIMDYPLTRGADADWGSGIVGHRSSKHYFAAPFLDGRKASIFLGRGAYTKHKMAAYDVDPATHKLTQRWYWECSDKNSPWFGQGYHNFAVGDVDWDGRDEIIFGSMVIDDNGKGLSTTDLGHGDSQHCADFDPFRKYEEQFACNEDKPGMNYRNAVTAQLYKRTTAGDDDGRALMGNFTNDYPGSVGRTVSTGNMLSAVSDKFISELTAEPFIPWADLNSRIYWDGDLLDEYMDSPGENGYAVVYKPGGGRVFDANGTSLTNSSKNNFCAQGDIFGDWREELVLRSSDNTELRIYATTFPTEYRIPTLWHDHQYRNAMVWQTMGYNQTPHKSYFLGELEDITIAPPPLTMTGRTEVANGGTITTTDEHLLVCETGNTNISIAEGASPYIVTFNVPSWVQGTAGNNELTKETTINYEYYTCNVTGGALAGAARLVKQGDGILNLPKVTMAHTGNTDIWNGTVNFDGAMQSSPVWLNRHTTLNTNGGRFASLKMEYGSTLDITGSATIGTLEMHEGARIKLNEGESVAINDFVVRNQKWQYGPKYLAPVFEVESASELAQGAKVQIGTLTGSVPENLDKVVVESNIALGKQGKLLAEDGKLYVTVDYDESLTKRVGEESTVYERGYETAWASGDASEATDVSSDYGIHKSGGDGNNSATISINPTIGNTMTLEAYWVGMSNTGRYFSYGNYSYFKYGDVLLMENDQDKAVAYSIDGGATYKTFGGNSTWANRDYDIATKNWMVIRMEIDTKTNTLNYLKVYSSSDLNSPLLSVLDEKLSDSFDYSKVAIGYKRGGNVTTTNNEYLQKLKVTEASYTYVYAGAEYKVRYVDESGSEVKPTETRMGIHGNPIVLEEEDKEDVFTDDGLNKWVYVSDDAGTLAEDGSTVVTVTFNKLYKYSVTATDENSEVIATIKTDYLDDADNITVFYDHGLMVDGKVYMKSANASAPYFGTVVNKSNLTKVIKYTYDPDIKYYVEAEDATTTRTYGTPANDNSYSGGGGVGVYQDARTSGEKVEAGVYTLTVKGIVRNAKNQPYSVRISNDNETFTEVGTVTFTNGATGEKTLSDIEIPEGYFVDILNTSGGNANNYLDYFYLTKQTTIGKRDYTSAFWTNFSETFTLNEGEKYHFNFKNYNSGKGSNWNNWVLAAANSPRGSNGYAEHFVLRNDNYAWGPEGNSIDDAAFKELIEMQSDFNWSSFVSDMNGSTVDMDVIYINEEVAVNAKITTIGGTVYNYSFSKKNITDGSISLFFTVDNSYISELSAKKVVIEDEEPTNVVKGTSQNTIEWIAQNRMSKGENTLTSASNAGNQYALGIVDLSNIKNIGDASSVKIEFDVNIPSGSRWLVGIGDKTVRGVTANGSSKSTYNTDGLIMRFGTTDGSYYRINGSTNNSSAFGQNIHVNFTLDRNKSSYSYTLTDKGGTTTYFSGSNVATSVDAATIIEAYTWANNATLSVTNVKVTLTGVPASLILEPKANDNYEPGIYETVTLNRSFSPGYSTICLPFNTDVEELTGGDNEAYVAYLSDVETDNDNTATLVFTNGTEIVANRPYILYLGRELDAPVFTNKAVYAELPKSVAINDWSMTANYEVGKSMAGIYGVAKNSSIMKGGANSTLNGFTAFLTGPANAQANARFADSGEVVGIDVSSASDVTIEGIYTSGGVKVPTLMKGINIVRMSDGSMRKIFVK